MTYEQGRFLLERSCFLLGCTPVATERCCSLESFYIFLERKQHGLGIVKSGETGIIFLARGKRVLRKILG